MRIAAVALLLCSPLLARTRLNLDDLLAIRPLPPHLLSPDGSQLAFTENGQIEVMDARGGPPALVTTSPGAKSELAWSPDGRKLAFVSQGAIWVVPAGGGTPARLTEGVAGKGDPRGAADHGPKWNPKGGWILFESGRHGRTELFVVSEDGAASTLLATAERYPSSAAAESLGAGDALSVDRFDPHPAWSPDGTRIAFTERAPEYFSGKLQLLEFDRETGHAKAPARTLYTAQPDRGGAWAVEVGSWSPDGQSIALVLQDSGWDNVYVLPLAGGSPRRVTGGEWDDNNPEFSPDGKSLAVVSSRGAPEERHIWIVPADGSAARELSGSPGGVESVPQWSPDGKLIYFVRSTPLESPDLFVAPAAGSQDPKRLTNTLPLTFRAAGLSAPAVAHFNSRDGLTIAGILFRPAGYQPGRKYPAVLWIHGGPEGQDTLAFSAWPLMLSQQGYFVLEPNYRGSYGYGEKFRNRNVKDSGGGEVDDVAAAARYLVDQGLSDPHRIAIAGGSHGGTMVNFAVTKYPDLFAAAIDISGVVNRATFLERTNRNSVFRWQTKMGGTPAEQPAVYRQANILPDVDKIRTPLLILHGQEDPQVPPYEAAQFARALEKSGKTFQYITYPREGHGFTDRDHKIDAWNRQLAFLRQYLAPEYGRSSTSVEP